MTPHETAMRLMRQRGTTTGHPEFVVAYLRAELDRDPFAFETDAQRAQRYFEAQVRAVKRAFSIIGQAAAGVALAFRGGFAG